MSVNLASAPKTYDARDQAKVRASIENADAQNFKRGQDVELARGEKLILRDTSGQRWAIVVSTGGVLSASGPL